MCSADPIGSALMYTQESLALKASKGISGKYHLLVLMFYIHPVKHHLIFAPSYLFAVHVLQLNGTKYCAVTSCNQIDLYGAAVVSLGARFAAFVSTQG